MQHYYSRKPAAMSLETALEEERRELVHEYEGRNGAGSRRNHRTTPTAPARSLLDIAPSPGALPPRHGSIAGIGHCTSSCQKTSTPRRTTSAVAPPPIPQKKSSADSEDAPRRSSDPLSVTKDNKTDNIRPRPSIRWDDSVTMPPSVLSQRRASQAQEKPPTKALQGRNAMAAVMSGLDIRVGLPSFTRGRSSSRNNSARGTSLDSRMPPKNRWLSPSSRSPASQSTKPTVEKPKPTEMESTGKQQPARPAARRQSSDDDVRSPTLGDERLEKDMYDSENNLIETSEEEIDDSTSSDDEASSERGRKKTSDRAPPIGDNETSLSTPDSKEQASADSPDDKSEKSEYTHSAKQGPIPKKPEVHPRTSFDTASAANTPFGSEDEAELSDIKRAQKLGIQMSAIDSSVHNRSIRTIIRGDYTGLSEQTESGRRRQRKYLVTTDLSEESVYALEWTIGTILRDGDTMFAVCAIHEETGAPTSVQIGEGAKAMQDAAAVVGSQTEETVQQSQNDSSTNLSRALLSRLGSGTDSKPSSVDSRGMSKAESERVHAVEVISQTCVRLLRKTVLQVRVAVEVIHCKSPKHMITEAIDGLEPTLVIVGARGRSALKGVLLGSFSNYLVMHSSVPVMVARKKLKKQSKTKKTNIRLSNNLSTPKKLAMAKID
ncbi:universal stress protein family domain protein [Aspergillus nomiae NRRL 13137]|uniref:Universal stress protein family domain protein n=1 Tax=Aspergillus nomiae NRRL (strain ATCC 15546 / NRRL 13137 / CBS 260.88 / M93) TaxID=1509407 RepID=A0A0L1INU9_ASPN3|nr:universal stress protein family domain protein [Aspergillus nomiae NRRL 13137]KNG81202.1 universal stress protein family domain protein [Aspergillus nomiae NRRL 13137]